jgi:hypothetical protein
MNDKFPLPLKPLHETFKDAILTLPAEPLLKAMAQVEPLALNSLLPETRKAYVDLAYAVEQALCTARIQSVKAPIDQTERLASQICQALRVRWNVSSTSSEDRELVARLIESQIGKS